MKHKLATLVRVFAAFFSLVLSVQAQDGPQGFAAKIESGFASRVEARQILVHDANRFNYFTLQQPRPVERASVASVEASAAMHEQLLVQTFDLLGANSPQAIQLVREDQGPRLRHLRYTVTRHGIAVRGSDIRVHLDSSSQIVSMNGQQLVSQGGVEAFAAQFENNNAVRKAVLKLPAAIALAHKTAALYAGGLVAASSFGTLASELQWVGQAPHLRYRLDVAQPKGMHRFEIDIDAITGEILTVQDRLRPQRSVYREGLRQ